MRRTTDTDLLADLFDEFDLAKPNRVRRGGGLPRPPGFFSRRASSSTRKPDWRDDRRRELRELRKLRNAAQLQEV
jgi:hypothetical protein